MKENICRFISSIQKIEGSNNLIELARKEKRFIDLEYPNIFTRRAKYRNYRNAIKLTDPNSPLLNVFTLSKEEAAKFKEDYAEKVKYDQTHLRQIYDFDALLSKALDLIEKGNYYEQVLGFAALTGRRTAEIGCTANFKVVSPYHVIFSGQLKTKGKKEADNYQIPILRKCHFVIEHFYFFRSKWKVRNVDVFNNTCATELSSRVKRDFHCLYSFHY